MAKAIREVCREFVALCRNLDLLGRLSEAKSALHYGTQRMAIAFVRFNHFEMLKRALRIPWNQNPDLRKRHGATGAIGLCAGEFEMRAGGQHLNATATRAELSASPLSEKLKKLGNDRVKPQGAGHDPSRARP
jgi:hypothetical protein